VIGKRGIIVGSSATPAAVRRNVGIIQSARHQVQKGGLSPSTPYLYLG
jgi:hypothetical protein